MIVIHAFNYAPFYYIRTLAEMYVVSLVINHGSVPAISEA